MFTITGTYVELQAEDPEALATFYERLAGLVRQASSAHAITLAGAGLTLRVKRGAPPEDESTALFGFTLGADSDLAQARAHAVACGAIALSETKREGFHAIMCTDPSGFAFTIARTEPATDAAPVTSAPGALAAIPSAESPTEKATPQPMPVVSAQKPAVAKPSITRRTIDRLRDVERLAQMQEAIAGLHGAFTPEDPATTLDDMRARIGAVYDPRAEALAEADALAREEARRTDAEALLDRYKRQLGDADDAPSRNQPRPNRQSVLERDDSLEVRMPNRTLGSSPDDEAGGES